MAVKLSKREKAKFVKEIHKASRINQSPSEVFFIDFKSKQLVFKDEATSESLMPYNKLWMDSRFVTSRKL